MGYTTEFYGAFAIDPPLPPELVSRLEEYCCSRHGEVWADIGCPSIWCDWQFSKDGTSMSWNGSEKSYDMLEWAQKLVKELIPAVHQLSGYIVAQGEYHKDRWRMVAEGRSIKRQAAVDSWEEED